MGYTRLRYRSAGTAGAFYLMFYKDKVPLELLHNPNLCKLPLFCQALSINKARITDIHHLVSDDLESADLNLAGSHPSSSQNITSEVYNLAIMMPEYTHYLINPIG